MDRPRQTKAGSLTPDRRRPLPVGWGRRADPRVAIVNGIMYDSRPVPETWLARIKSAGHIAMEHDPKLVAGTLAEFFAAEH